ncbi:polynucleotide 5'-hydroxyl-kinase NOL9-like isoform X2 [Malania oleifera]|uniref:polynucleotide 5'-hydroxyl-kinase NOL9-like isoform X2 n=1 Tax=Malania oleifera TaxID=397392 RepID=UPI0025AEC832|nr:polynucleotide 5'-hydroxyl-kinase NOL9-like isoform X2 [Malania oleifera]XP_057952160.1 polynucleotide 5'-hydroxyl-kinase NOL9-like isoform X2 [Malania oleifera]
MKADGPGGNIIIPKEWSDAAETIARDSITSPPPIALICGARGCGKSTFSRFLVNTFLSRSSKYERVAYLDTDVGQTEFAPPGCLSLSVIDKEIEDLTIPCLKTPERAFFFGDVSSKRDPEAYLNYILALYDYYKEYCMFSKSKSSRNTPLLVNTPGWVKGIGYNTLVDMLKRIAPSHVVKISVPCERKNLPDGAFWLDGDCDETQKLFEINSARQDFSDRLMLVQKDARLLRDMRIMAYFRQCIPNNMNISTIRELAHALVSHPPYEISISSVKIRHLHCQVPRTEIFRSLNASLVGLAISSEESEQFSHCVGLGIVRAIDTSKHLLYVITPVPQSTLEKVDLFLQGFVQIPTCLLQVEECMSPYMSANVWDLASKGFAARIGDVEFKK